MITNIKINSVTSYKQETQLETNTPISLVYGLNGSGKTTIANYLQNPTHTDFQRCRITPNVTEDYIIRVYNQSFVEDVFYNKDVQKGIFTLSKENKDIELQIDVETKKREAIAKKGTELKEQIEKKNEEVEKLDKETQEACFEIKRTFSGGDRVFEDAGFLDGFKVKKKLFSKLQETDLREECREIDVIKKEVEQLQEADGVPSSELTTIQLTEELKEVESNPIFEEIIVSRSNSTLSELIEKLNNTNWFTQGVPYLEISADQCPFCQQDVDSERKNEIINFLDEAYKQKIKNLNLFAKNYKESAENMIPINEGDLIEKFATEDQKLQLEIKHENLRAALLSNVAAIEAKILAPNEVKKIKSLKLFVEACNEALKPINEAIRGYNTKLLNKEKTLSCLKIEFWEVQRKKYAQTLADYSNHSGILQGDLKKLQDSREVEVGKYKVCDENIKTLQKQTVNIQDTIDQINLLLTECGITGVHLEQEGERFYKIVRGDANSEEQVFHTLSEGEKTMISFFYFLELCRGKGETDETQKKIIVIDDPISSLSHMYVYNVAQFIKREFFDAFKLNKSATENDQKWLHKPNTQYQQCFVLTHSLYFFYELADSLNHNDRKILASLYRVNKGDNGSHIASLKYSEIQNDYQAYWSIVREPDTPTALLANSMRNIIEHFFNFLEKLDLNCTFQKAALADNKFQSFKRYMGRESHTLAQNIFDTKEFDYEIFKEAFKLVFEENGYSDHYKKMMK